MFINYIIIILFFTLLFIFLVNIEDYKKITKLCSKDFDSKKSFLKMWKSDYVGNFISNCRHRSELCSGYTNELINLYNKESELIKNEIFSSTGQGFVRTTEIEDYLREVFFFY
jgi:hypothetical protein